MRAYANEYLNFAFALLLTLIRRAKAPVALSLWHTVASMAQYNGGNQSAPIDITSTLGDFKKTVSDYLAREVSKGLSLILA